MTKLLEKMANRKELKWPLKLFMLLIAVPGYIIRAILLDLTQITKNRPKN